jgi:hypothetical protein
VLLQWQFGREEDAAESCMSVACACAGRVQDFWVRARRSLGRALYETEATDPVYYSTKCSSDFNLLLNCYRQMKELRSILALGHCKVQNTCGTQDVH